MIDAKHIEEIEKLEKVATPPPWPVEIWYGNDGGFAAIGPVHKSKNENDFESPEDENGQQAMHDAEFISMARKEIPRLIVRIRELEKEVAG